MRFKVYYLIERAVEQGAAFAASRSLKHTDKPSQQTIEENVVREVMLALDEILEFDEGKEEE